MRIRDLGSPLIVYPTRLDQQDIEALQDRAKIENSTPTAIARTAIRWYLIQTRPTENPPAA